MNTRQVVKIGKEVDRNKEELNIRKYWRILFQENENYVRGRKDSA